MVPLLVSAVLLGLVSRSVAAQEAAQVPAPGTQRLFRIDVRDKSGRPIPDAMVTFFLTGDSVRTDSSGIASITVAADTAVNITVRKIGFEPRNARFKIGTAPAFNVRVALGDAGQRLAEIEIKDSYPGEPWRPGFAQRKKRGGGQFRDISYFPGGVPFSFADWFNGMNGVRTAGGTSSDISVPRCRGLGVWIDGQHVTSPNSGYRFALSTVPPQDIGALELYTANTPAQYTGQGEDCSLLIWTRGR
jgi:hypothetical protein